MVTNLEMEKSLSNVQQENKPLIIGESVQNFYFYEGPFPMV